MDDKVIVTNLSALKKKYGRGYSQIKTALDALIAADKKRGLNTRLVALDSATTMKRLKATTIKDAADAKQNKRAIDGVYTALAPDYLLILGSIDIVPHQDMKNPVFDGNNDPDEFAYGDLPYACDAPYSQNAADFIGPTRVIGRLPDITGASDPAYLSGLLRTAASAQSRPRADYANFLGLSAQVWEKSTRLSLERLAGSGRDVRLSPREGPQWKPELLSRRLHFINCHGAPTDPHFYGQTGSNFPTAHSAALLAGNLSEGTVAAMECCYGAELYDAKLVDGTQVGIGNTYLGNKAYGYFGSTTIAYGPAVSNGAADLLCRFFLQRVLAGASLGRATLEARQEFAGHAPELDPVDLKTLAQFNLLGDPSLHPVIAVTPHQAVARTASAKALPPDALDRAANRAGRRQLLARRGAWLAQNQPVAQPAANTVATTMKRSGKAAKTRTPSTDRSALNALISEMELHDITTQTFDVAAQAPAATSVASKTRAAKAVAAKLVPAVRMHVVLGQRADKGRAAAPVPAGVEQTVALVAKEVAGKIVSYRELFAR